MDYKLFSNNNDYSTHHCWIPKVCSCLDSRTSLSEPCSSNRRQSYERLSYSNQFQCQRRQSITHRMRYNDITEDHTIDNERHAEIRFYNDNYSWTTIVVEKNLRTIDLCELLKVKNQVSGVHWSIIELWPELGIERALEDHEDILRAYKEGELFAAKFERKFYFRKDCEKHEFFNNPKIYFPPDMVISLSSEDRNSLLSSFEHALRGCLMWNDFELPKICSDVWILNKELHLWEVHCILLEDRKLFTIPMVNRNSMTVKQILDNNKLVPFIHLSDYHIYKIPNAKKYFYAPFQWGACLRPTSNAEAEDTEEGVAGLKVIAFNSEKSRTCWLTAMRLAKYGKQLKDNYRAFKNKSEPTPPSTAKEQFRNYNVSNESFRSRVAMDFTGSVGRIVEDPKEARAIAESEGLLWRQTWRPSSRMRTNFPEADDSIHGSKPWFHKAVNREKAANLVKGHGKVNGVFLVRESRSYPGAFVLTYKYGDKIFHAPIHRTVDEKGNGCLFTLDKGVTKFYDLVQLVDFYQLNSGSLPTRLTHYVDNGLSPSPSTDSSSVSTSASPSSTKQICSPRKNEPNGTKTTRS